MRIDLIKYQALGNDYLVLDLPGPLEELVPLLPVLCDRHRGLGSDGLLAFDPPSFAVRVFNPDSSEAQKSGNGLRIAAAHAVLEHGAGDRFELHTIGRANPVRVLGRNGAEVMSELDIGRASFRAADLPALFDGEPDRVHLETGAGQVEAMLVSVGNPHCVVFGEPATRERCLELGPLLESHPAFPERTNVQLFRSPTEAAYASRSGSAAPATRWPRGPAPAPWPPRACGPGSWTTASRSRCPAATWTYARRPQETSFSRAPPGGCTGRASTCPTS